MAFTVLTNVCGPSTQPTSCRSPTCSLLLQQVVTRPRHGSYKLCQGTLSWMRYQSGINIYLLVSVASPVLPMLNLSQWLIHWEFCVFFKWANPGLFLFIFVLFKHKKSSIWWQQFNLPVLIDDVIFYLFLFRKATSSSSSSYLRFFAFYCVCIDIKFYWIVVRTQALSI